jgi:hypothetical protein
VTTQLDAALAGIEAALADEIDAVRARGTTRTLHFSRGEVVSSRPGIHTYRLKLSSPPGRLDAVSVAVMARGFVQTGELLDVDGRDVLVCVPRDLGNNTGAGAVEIDPSAVLEATAARLAAARSGDASLDMDSVARLLTPAHSSAGLAERPGQHAGCAGDACLDPYQAAAVAAALNQDLAFVWGPPGTGKTRTLGHLAAAAVANGEQVVLTAHTHAAVDTAVLAALDAGCTAVLRVGTPQLPEVPDPVSVRTLAGVGLDGGVLVAATLAKLATSADFAGLHADRVVIDEASMAGLAQIVLAVGLGRRTVVFGDFRQLPPIVQSSTPAARRWLGTDVFSIAGVPAAVARGTPEERVHLLRRQYRSHPRIAAVVNEFAYGGRLESAGKVAGCDLLAGATPAPGETVVVWDTARLAPPTIRPDASRCNPTTAVLAAAACAAACGAAPALAGGIRYVGAVTPYTEQVRLLRALLEDMGRAEDVDVGTVHRFQGGEREFILIDLCDTPPHEPPPFLRGDEGVRLLNVAMSRARSKLILLAPLGAFRSGPCAEALELCTRQGVTVDAADTAAAGLSKLSWLDVDTFLANAADAIRMGDDVLVRAPRLRPSPVSDALRSAAATGQVTVVTDHGADRDLLARLAGDGAAVAVLPRVTERVVVAGDDVYTGNTTSPAAREGAAMLAVRAPSFARRLRAVLVPRAES